MLFLLLLFLYILYHSFDESNANERIDAMLIPIDSNNQWIIEVLMCELSYKVNVVIFIA